MRKITESSSDWTLALPTIESTLSLVDNLNKMNDFDVLVGQSCITLAALGRDLTSFTSFLLFAQASLTSTSLDLSSRRAGCRVLQRVSFLSRDRGMTGRVYTGLPSFPFPLGRFRARGFSSVLFGIDRRSRSVGGESWSLRDCHRLKLSSSLSVTLFICSSGRGVPFRPFP
jgi:hypothetical protein